MENDLVTKKNACRACKNMSVALNEYRLIDQVFLYEYIIYVDFANQYLSAAH